MDLQLGLAVVPRNSATKDFDLNFSEIDHQFKNNNNVKKRGFYEEEEEEEENENDVVLNDQTLPLLLWNYQREEDDTVCEDNLDSSDDNDYK